MDWAPISVLPKEPEASVTCGCTLETSINILTDRGVDIPAKSLAADLLLLRPRAITAVRLSLCGVGWQIIFRVRMMCTVVPFPVLTGPRRTLYA